MSILKKDFDLNIFKLKVALRTEGSVTKDINVVFEINQ